MVLIGYCVCPLRSFIEEGRKGLRIIPRLFWIIQKIPFPQRKVRVLGILSLFARWKDSPPAALLALASVAKRKTSND